MEIRKTVLPNNSKGEPMTAFGQHEFIFFKVKFNNFREISNSSENAVLDKEVMEECECVLWLPDSYSDDGEPTQLILSFHGSGGRVWEQANMVGGVRNAEFCNKAGFACLDVNGSAIHGRTLGCPEHLFAIYKAYKYVIKHYNLTEKVLVAGESMGGQTAMNFANNFPSIVLAAGLFYPRLNLDGITVDGHYCIGTWDKTQIGANGKCTRDYITEIYRFPSNEWCDENTVGFNPHRSRSFINSDGQRVVMPPCPIKIWQGTADTVVDPLITQEYVRCVRRGGCYIELHMLDGVAHRANSVMREELMLWFNRFV